MSESLKQTKYLRKKTLAAVSDRVWGEMDIPKQGQSPDLLTHGGRYDINNIDL